MKRNTWIAITLSLIVCTVTLLWQRKGIAELEDKVDDARNDIASLKASGGGTGHIRKKSAPADSTPAGPGAPADSDSATRESPKISVRELLQIVPDEQGGPASFVRLLPPLLDRLESHSTGELFALVNELNEETGQKQKAQSVLGLLLILLSGVEPEGVLEFARQQKDAGIPGTMQEVQTAAFSALARRDPKAARDYLEASGWKDRLKQQAQLGLIRELARQDFPGALAYIRESKFNEPMAMSVLAQAARDPAVRDNIRKALATVDDPVMRDNLATGLVGATLYVSGFEGVSALLDTMDFPDAAARDKAMLGAANVALSTQPAETIEWIMRETSPARRGEYLANSIRSWAYKDYNAAGAWLENQEASPLKDAAISAFATTVVNLDQEAAAVWAGQIVDETVRATARRRVLTEWHRRNAEGAIAWMREQGMDPSEWIPGAAAGSNQ